MFKKLSFLASAAFLLAFAPAALAIDVTVNEPATDSREAVLTTTSIDSSAVTSVSSDFGQCPVDPITETSFIAEALTSARVRDFACMEGSKMITAIPKGGKVQVIGSTDGWYKIKTTDDRIGWIGATLLKRNDDQAAIESYATLKLKASSSKNVLSSLAERLKGRILLAVEQNGEAYYVGEDGTRIYLKDGQTAYGLMRGLGLGVSSADLEKILAGDITLKTKLKGKIILAVEKKGEAYYINPTDLSVIYLKDGNEAYKLMREKGLGVSNENISKLSEKTLEEYKSSLDDMKSKIQSLQSEIEKLKEQIKNFTNSIKETVKNKIESPEKKIETSNTTIPVSGTIKLVSSVVEGKQIKLSWTTDGVSAPKGFKTVISRTENPIYPGNDYHYLDNPEARSDVWERKEGGVYYLRVCQYLGDKCGVYSNNVKVTLDGPTSVGGTTGTTPTTTNANGSIRLEGYFGNSKVSLKWTLSNMTSAQGFKVVYSDKENPVYPGNEYHYLTEPTVRSDFWESLPAGVYYFRVCEYLGGKCGIYSNNLRIEIPGESNL